MYSNELCLPAPLFLLCYKPYLQYTEVPYAPTDPDSSLLSLGTDPHPMRVNVGRSVPVPRRALSTRVLSLGTLARSDRRGEN